VISGLYQVGAHSGESTYFDEADAAVSAIRWDEAAQKAGTVLRQPRLCVRFGHGFDPPGHEHGNGSPTGELAQRAALDGPFYSFNFREECLALEPTTRGRLRCAMTAPRRILTNSMKGVGLCCP